MTSKGTTEATTKRTADAASATGGPQTPARFCDHCGEPLDSGVHDSCVRLRALEPPRFCAFCRRRMVVQVVPRGWGARCVEHGEIGSAPNG